jgi:hypothetical protein
MLVVGSSRSPALGERDRSRLAAGHDRGRVTILDIATACEFDVDPRDD